METDIVWNDQIPEKDGVKLSVHDIAISPDGSRLIAAVGTRVLFYRTSDGDLLDSLRGHKDTVYSLGYSGNGTRFASGGADNVVIIWKSSGQGLLKYNHSAPIQKVAFNPNSIMLVSCSEVDFGIWTPDQKSVTKEKMSSRIVSACWSSDGTYFAIGTLSGLVSVRNQKAEEVMRVERRAPIWCLAFVPEHQGPVRPQPGAQGNFPTGSSAVDHSDNLAVGCWDKTYCLYKLTSRGAILQAERKLAYFPLSLRSVSNYATKTNFMVVSGSNKQVQILSREGVKLADVSKVTDSWIWCADCSAEEDTLAYGTHHGLIEFVQTKFDSVHSIYRDRFAFRENLTEVIVHHLVTDKKVRIKCKDMIHNLSLFRNKLAVQLLDRICVYESNADDDKDIHFRLRKERILLASASFNLESKAVTNLMVATSQHVFTCLDQYLELYHQDGRRVRLWKMDAVILCLHNDGGLDGREGIFVGLADGKVFKFHVDEPFPIEVATRKQGVVSVCQNIYRTLLATIDSHHHLVVSEVSSQEVLYTLDGVLAASFNSEIDDLLCVTSVDQSISVVAGLISRDPANRGTRRTSSTGVNGGIEVQEMHIQGKVVGFAGQKIFSTQRGLLNSVDVPQEKNIAKALEAQDYTTAYKIACLGATESDWRLLAMRALRANQLQVSKNAFARLKDARYLSLIETIERHSGPSSVTSALGTTAAPLTTFGTGPRGRDRAAAGAAARPMDLPAAQPQLSTLEPRWLAEIMAMEGHFNEAAKLFARGGQVDEAINLFTLLRKFEDAKAFARSTGQGDVSELTAMQAKWLQEIRDWKGASELLLSMGQFGQAARLIGENIPVASAKTSKDGDRSNEQKDGDGGDRSDSTGEKKGAATAGLNSPESKAWAAVMMEAVRACPADDKDTLSYCAEKLSFLDDVSLAKETCLKAQDYARLMALYVQRQLWTEAAKLADEYQGKFDMAVFASYAEWLVSQDRYEEAMEAFKKSGRMDLSRKVLTELTFNAVSEHRFKDAGYYYWMLAKELEAEVAQDTASALALRTAAGGVVDKTQAQQQQEREHSKVVLISECEHKADLYYAYSIIYGYVMDPFTTYQPEMLFQVARFIINSLGISDSIPQGISKTFTLYTLAKQAMQLGAFKLARNAYDRLSRLKIPERKQEEVELDMLLVQAKPVRDDPDHLPVCYRCGSVNPLLNPFTNRFAKGDVCTNCGHPFVRSFINFDILPLVEFVPEPSISDEEAMEMIRQPPTRSAVFLHSKSSESKANYMEDDGANILTFEEAKGNGGSAMDTSILGDQESHDLFTQCLNITLEKQKTSYIPVQVDSNTLLAMKRSEVFVCKPSSKSKRATFYKNMLPEISIAISQPCHRFFHLEDFEFAYLSEKQCPYSRLKNIGEYGSI